MSARKLLADYNRADHDVARTKYLPLADSFARPEICSGSEGASTAIPVLVGLWGMFLLLREGEDRVAMAIIVIIILLFPLPYYATLTMPRYRAPIEPFLVLLSVYGLLSI